MVGIKPSVICPACGRVVENVIWLDEGTNWEDEDRVLQYPSYLCSCGYDERDVIIED